MLSIVIPSWNTRDDLRRCLDSLPRTSVPFEVVVVDNASTDGTVAMLGTDYPEVKLVECRDNQGFARACNQGMAAAKGEFVLLLNSDTYVDDDVIGRAVVELRSRPEISMLGVRVSYPDGRLQHTAKRALSIRSTLLERLWLYKLLPTERRAFVLLDGYFDHDCEVEVDWLSGTFMLLRRSVYEQSGGFDERFFMYGEDSEWCMRLRKEGHRIVFTPKPGTVRHTGCVSSDLKWSEKERLRLCYRGGLESYAAVNGWPLTIGFWLAELFGNAVRLLAYRLLRKLRPDPYYSQQARMHGWLVGFYLGR